MKNYAKKYLSLFVAVLMAMMMLIPTAAFAASNPTLTVDPTVTTVLVQGDTATITATLTNAANGATVEETEWEIADSATGIAISNGDDAFTQDTKQAASIKVKGLTKGVYTINASVPVTGNESATATATVIVVSNDGTSEDLAFDEDSYIIDTTTGSVTATVTAADGSALNYPENVVLTSDDTSVATVDSTLADDGTVTIQGVSAGSTTITATYTAGGKVTQATCTVYVDEASLVKHVYVNGVKEANVDVASVGDTTELTLTLQDSSGNDIPISALADDAITIDNGGNAVEYDSDDGVYVVTTATKGTTTVKFTVNDISAAANIIVASEKVSKITISGTDDDLAVGDTDTLTATVENSTADDTTVTWASSNEDIATVEQIATDTTTHTAKLTVKAVGEATITATANDGSGVKGEYTVSVEGLQFNNDTVTVSVGDEFPAAYGYYGINPNNLKWMSSNTAVASVDQDGNITANAIGKATITATDNSGHTDSMVVIVTDAGTAVYRLYNRNSGEHFYTTDADEKDNLVSLGWKDEGIGWYGASEDDGAPVYRLYNANGGEHHYTTSESEKDTLVKAGWSYEGIEFYVSTTATEYPVYRNYNPNAFANNHNFTTNEEEYTGLIEIGWDDEGIAFYAVNPGTNG